MGCNHKCDQLVWIGKNNLVYMECANCGITIQPTISYKKPLPDNYKTELNLITKIIR